MLQGMDQSQFGQFVAALWERQDWQTQVKRDEGRTFVAVQRPETGEEGLLWAIPDEGDIGGKQVQQFASLCEGYEVEEAAIVTAGTLSDHAEKVAQGTGVELLDGEGVTAILQRKGLTDLASKYGANDGNGGGGRNGNGSGSENGNGGGSPLDQLRGVAGRMSTLVSNVVGSAGGSVSGTSVVLVVAVVALLGAGVLFGPSVPFLGGGDGFTATSATPDNSTTTLHVQWNAAVVDEIDPNESDELAYYPPEGKQFVVVRMSINNTGERSMDFKQAAFKFETDERTYGHQPLADHEGFLDFPISPGQHYVGWTVFSVPEGTTGTLIYDQNGTDVPVAVEFERNRNLPANVTQR